MVVAACPGFSVFENIEPMHDLAVHRQCHLDRRVARGRRDRRGRGGTQGAGHEAGGNRTMIRRKGEITPVISSAHGRIRWQLRPKRCGTIRPHAVRIGDHLQSGR
jgi:hypothetical protein